MMHNESRLQYIDGTRSHVRTLPGHRSRPGFGHTISHSHRRTKRRFDPNIQRKRYWVPSLGRHVRLTVSAKGIKTIDRRGIDAIARELIVRGEKI